MGNARTPVPNAIISGRQGPQKGLWKMGCDIHTMIEYRFKNTQSWWSFWKTAVTLDRDYQMFCRIAGVRKLVGAKCVEPRGIPEDATWYTINQYTYTVVAKEAPEQDCECGYCNVTDRETADTWLKSGCSKKWKDEDHRITGPDWHSASWLSYEELIAIATEYRLTTAWRLGTDWRATLAAMAQFYNDGCEIRLVFWFDN